MLKFEDSEGQEHEVRWGIGLVTVGIAEGGVRDIEIDHLTQEVGHGVRAEFGRDILAVAQTEEEGVTG